MLLDNQHRLLDYQELFFGTINAGTIHPREVVRRPSTETPQRSYWPTTIPPVWSSLPDADKAITTRLKELFEMVDDTECSTTLWWDSTTSSRLPIGGLL